MTTSWCGIAVTVSSDTVTIESEQRSTPDNRVDLEGPISDISLAIRVVTLAGVVVGVPTDDIIHRGTEQLTLADLQIGDVARVLGVPDGGMVQAVDIEILSPPRAAILTLAGEVSALSGGCPFLMFGVAGTPVETSGATLFRAALCTDLVEGGSVAVSGELSGGVLHAADVLIETDTIQGVVTGLSGSCPTASFTLDGTTVTTDSATQYVGGACADVREGSEVIVAGVLVGASLRAASITVTDEMMSLEGAVAMLGGTCPVLSFTVLATPVTTDALTVFDIQASTDSTPDSESDIFGDLSIGFVVAGASGCAALEEGDIVQVSGRLVSGVLQAGSVVSGSVDDGKQSAQQQSASIEGRLTALSGVDPNLVLLVDGTTVRTSAETRVTRHGVVQTFDVLSVGMTVHAVGERQSDGSLDARKLQIKADEVGDPFQITGSMGGRRGECPTVQFGIKGFSLTTDAATMYTGGSCGVLASGLTVTIDGTVQADGSILVATVEIAADQAKKIRLEGAVSTLAGICPAVSFSVGGGEVLATSDTQFRKGDCEHLTNGMEVRADGRLVNGLLLASSVTLSEADTGAGNGNDDGGNGNGNGNGGNGNGGNGNGKGGNGKGD